MRGARGVVGQSSVISASVDEVVALLLDVRAQLGDEIRGRASP